MPKPNYDYSASTDFECNLDGVYILKLGQSCTQVELLALLDSHLDLEILLDRWNVLCRWFSLPIVDIELYIVVGLPKEPVVIISSYHCLYFLG